MRMESVGMGRNEERERSVPFLIITLLKEICEDGDA